MRRMRCVTRSTPAPGRPRDGLLRWSSTSRASWAAATARSTSSIATRIFPSTTWISCPCRAWIPTHPRSPAYIISDWYRRWGPSAPASGWISTASCSASSNCRRAASSASFPRARCCAAPVAVSTCNSWSRPRGPRTSTGTKAWCVSASAHPTSRRRPVCCASGAWSSSTRGICIRANGVRCTQVYLGSVTFELVASKPTEV